MDTKAIIRILKKSLAVYHTTIIHTKLNSGLNKAYDIEPYEYKIIDGLEFLIGYDINEKEEVKIPISTIVEVVDTGKKFTPKRSSPTGCVPSA